jgi:DNA primase
MPLRWSEVNSKLNIRDFTIDNAVARMKKLKRDPVCDVVTASPDLTGAIERLGQRG